MGPPTYRRGRAFADPGRHQRLPGHRNHHSEPETPAFFEFNFFSSGDTHRPGNADTPAFPGPGNGAGSDRLARAVSHTH